MPLSTEKLRVLTFPQRINGRALDLHVLLLPTQRLLNVLDPFPSVLNPGNSVELPKFIKANLSLCFRRHQRAGKLSVFQPGKPDRRRDAPDAADRRGVPCQPARSLRRSRDSVQARRSDVRQKYGGRTGACGRCRRHSQIPAQLVSCGLQLHDAADTVCEDRRQLSLRDQAVVREEPGIPTVAGRDHVGSRDCVLPAAAASGGANRAAAQVPGHAAIRRLLCGGGWVSCRVTSTLSEFDIVNADTELRSYAARIPEIDGPRQLFAALQFPAVPDRHSRTATSTRSRSRPPTTTMASRRSCT